MSLTVVAAEPTDSVRFFSFFLLQILHSPLIMTGYLIARVYEEIKQLQCVTLCLVQICLVPRHLQQPLDPHCNTLPTEPLRSADIKSRQHFHDKKRWKDRVLNNMFTLGFDMNVKCQGLFGCSKGAKCLP